MHSLRKFSALMLVILFAMTAAAQDRKSGPKLTVESFTHDFGEVNAGASLKYTFKIRYTGASDLQIQNVAPS